MRYPLSCADHDEQSPSNKILVENNYCNWSGGCALGSLGANTSIDTVTYRNVYTWSSNQMMMIKSNGGSGTVTNALFENFIGHGNACASRASFPALPRLFFRIKPPATEVAG